MLVELAGSVSVFQNLSGEGGNDSYELGAGAGLVSIGVAAESSNTRSDDRVNFRDLGVYDVTIGETAEGEVSFHWND